MKCPHCTYEHGWNGNIMQHVEGNKGKFFVLSGSYGQPLTMVRESAYGTDSVNLCACPKCKKTFIDI